MASEGSTNPELKNGRNEQGDLSKKDLIDLAYKHVETLQKDMNKYDKTGETIRNWTIGLWTATLIAGLTQKVGGEKLWMLIVVSIAIPIVMGIYDEIFKTFRQNYKKERDVLLEVISNDRVLLSNLYFPNQERDWKLIRLACSQFLGIGRPHVNIIYWMLILISIMIALGFVVSNSGSSGYAVNNIHGYWEVDEMHYHYVTGFHSLMGFGMNLIWLLAIAVMAYVLYRFRKLERILETSKSVTKSVQEVLDERYAKGEIKKDEYDITKADLKAGW